MMYTMTGDDNDICDSCGSHFVAGRLTEEMFWIGCDYLDCGKWFHTHCIGMSNEEYNRR